MKNLFVLFFSLLAITVLGQRSGTVMTSYNNSSAVASTTVTENSLPSIEITSPSDGDTLTIDTSFTASVTATDSDGTIDSVVFFINDTRQAVDVSSPYSYNLPTGSVINRELKAIAYDNDLGSAVDSINYYINDTTTPVVPTCATDTIFTTDWKRNDAANIIQVDNFALDSNSIDAMNTTSTRWIKGALANDMDSLYVVISTSSATPVEFRITTATDSIDWTHTTTTGSYTDFRGDWAPITGLQGDSVKIRVINRFCHFDYAVVQKGGYPCSSEVPNALSFNIPENEDHDYFIGVMPDSVDNTAYTETGGDGKTRGLPYQFLGDGYDKVYVRNDSLFSKYSFDYEDQYFNDESYYAYFPDEADGDTITIIVNVTDVTGALDQNGLAGKAFNDKFYDKVDTNLNNYIYWNANAAENTRINTNSDNLDDVDRIYIHEGYYEGFDLFVQTGVSTTDSLNKDSGHRLFVTNWLGQVTLIDDSEIRGYFENVVYTGEYNTSQYTGHRDYQGFDTDSMFMEDKFGFHVLAIGPRRTIPRSTPYVLGTSNYGNALRIGNTGFEHYGFKITYWSFDGNWFSCINNKMENTYGTNRKDTATFIYASENDYEVFYWGNTSGGTQQIQDSIYIADCVLMGSGGENIQLSWVKDAEITNVTMEGSKSHFGPFQGGQQGSLQLKTGPGGVDVSNVIILATGHNINLEQRNLSAPALSEYGYSVDSLTFVNSYFGGQLGPNCMYINGDGDAQHAAYLYQCDFAHANGVQPDIWGIYNNSHDTIVGAFYSLLDPDDTSEWYNGNAQDFYLDSIFLDNSIDSVWQYSASFGGAKQGVITNLVRGPIERPDFVNFMGITDQGDTLDGSNGVEYDPNRYFHFRRFMGETAQNQGISGYTTLASNTWPDPIPYDAGMIVSDYDELDGNKMKFYLCLQDYADTSVVPWEPEDSIYWKELTWTMPNGWISYRPPRDMRLKSGNRHAVRGRGMRFKL